MADEVARLRALPYEQLLALDGQELHCERLVPSGAYVLRETGAYIDDDRARTVRVYVDARQPQEGYAPPSVAKDDFIVAPDGSFVGE
ncbi:MAG TPA: hypothetical protein VD931_02395 [Baekduia sp.]|nr:hypothetical protein [Baekduia sp.]